MPQSNLPRFVIFEGVDGTGKTSLSRALVAYYRERRPEMTVFHDAFPGARPGTLGEWVYRFHHGTARDAPKLDGIDPVARQLLHVAAHVDTIRSQIMPILTNPEGGTVILDRYWWSTYAYSRPYLSPEQALAILEPERVFWREMQPPVAVYLTRQRTLKPDELDQPHHQQLAAYYGEIVAQERATGMVIHEIANNGTFEELWQQLVSLIEKQR